MANNNSRMSLLRIIQWNARSMRPKRNELELLMVQEKIHIALISETWLEPDSYMNISGYNIFRKDRIDGYGGVAIIVSKSIKVQPCLININNSGIEMISIKLLNCSQIKNIVLIYCPSSVHTSQSDWEQIFLAFPSKCIVAGDFNGHHSTWSSKSDGRGGQIFDAALDAGYISLNDGSATRVSLVDNNFQQTSPDVTFVSSDISVVLNWSVMNENLGSDHLFIKITYKYNNNLNPMSITKKRNFKLAKWAEYSKSLENYLMQPIDDVGIQSRYDNFIEQVNKAADENIPVLKYCNNPESRFRPKPYWNPTLSRLVAQRRLALKNFRGNPTPSNLTTLENITEVAKTAIAQAKTADWQGYCSSIDEQTSSSDMWKRMGWTKGFTTSKSSVSNEQKLELLCSLAPDYVYPKLKYFESNNMELEADFTLQEMCNCFKKKDTAAGNDGITYSLIYHLSPVSRLYLLDIYNDIFNTGTVPMQWRNILVSPIPKTSANNSIKLRPISLLSCVCKIFHSMLTKRLEWYIEKNKMLSQYTSGFRRGQSCQDCLVRLVSQIYLGFSRRIPTVACFLDITNAYNNVLIEVLTRILDEIGIGKKLCQYLWNFLSERHLMMTDETDRNKHFIRYTSRGLAQGDPISPLLFNILTIKLFHKIKNVTMCQYADDFVLYSSSKNLRASQNEFQIALNTFCNILDEMGLELSASKSKVCIFSRGFRKLQIELKLQSQNLELVDNYKYLGVWIDRSLRWNKHINMTVEKVQKNLNLLKVLAGAFWGLHPKHLRHLYIALIRSRIDYSCYLYDASAKCHLDKLNKIQNQGLRIIGGFIKTTPIHVMESELCVIPLYLRRKYLAYKFCLKSKSIEDNVTNQFLSELYTLRQNCYWKNKTIPLLVTLYNEMKEIQISFSYPLLMYTLRTWVTNINVNEVIRENLEAIKLSKNSYDSNLLKYEIIRELSIKYNEWFLIFTDGSKSVEGHGSAFYVPSINIENNKNHHCFKIGEQTSIMTLELVAISEALTFVTDSQHKNVVICTDSKSSLQHIARCASGYRGASIAYVIISKIDALRSKGDQLRLQWVPSHIGLRGNEEADKLAKYAVKNGKEIYFSLDYSEYLPKFKKLCYDLWKEYFNKRSLEVGIWYKTIQCQPLHVPWFMDSNLSRKLVVTAHRLRSGHIPCNKFAFMMRKTTSPNCEQCGVVEDLHHLLVECVRYESVRNKLISALNLNKTDVGIFHKILSRPNGVDAKVLFEFMAHL